MRVVYQFEGNHLIGFPFFQNAFDFFVCGFLEDKVFSGKPTSDKMKTANVQEVVDISTAPVVKVKIHLSDDKA